MLLEHSKCGPIGLAVLKRYVNYNNIETLCSSCSGYMAPEYAMRGHYSIKSDVFSFGILMLEFVTGRRSSGSYNFDESVDLLSLVSSCADPELLKEVAFVVIQY